MRMDRYEGGDRERKSLAGLATDPRLLASLAPNWPKDGLSAPWSNLLASWCVEHYLRYATAPGKDLVGIYRAWAETGADRATEELVESFLRAVSDELDGPGGDKGGSEYLRNLALEHLDYVRLDKLQELIRADLQSGNIAKAKSRVSVYSPLEMGTGAAAGVSVFQDKEALARAFDRKSDPIVEYPGPLGISSTPASRGTRWSHSWPLPRPARHPGSSTSRFGPSASGSEWPCSRLAT